MPGEADGARVGVVVERPPGEEADPHPTSKSRTRSALKKPNKRWIYCIRNLLVCPVISTLIRQQKMPACNLSVLKMNDMRSFRETFIVREKFQEGLFHALYSSGHNLMSRRVESMK